MSGGIQTCKMFTHLDEISAKWETDLPLEYNYWNNSTLFGSLPTNLLWILTPWNSTSLLWNTGRFNLENVTYFIPLSGLNSSAFICILTSFSCCWGNTGIPVSAQDMYCTWRCPRSCMLWWQKKVEKDWWNTHYPVLWSVSVNIPIFKRKAQKLKKFN